jgi:TolB-like protein
MPEGRLRSEHSMLSPVLVRRQLEKILSSTRFRRCERMSRLLRVLVEYTLDHDDGPNAHYIAAQVFDKQDFDPRIDPIVRVEARRLRKILYDYYQGEGVHDHLVVSLPRGGYRTSFTRRTVDGPVRNLPLKSIAVLPFVNMTNDGGREAFCEGVTEELINALTRMDDLKVAARTSAFQYKEPHDVRDIGKDLGVTAVMEGSVRVAEERIRVTAQLSSASDGFHLWSQTFDAPFHETFELQEQLATEIATMAGKKLQALR